MRYSAPEVSPNAQLCGVRNRLAHFRRRIDQRTHVRQQGVWLP